MSGPFAIGTKLNYRYGNGQVDPAIWVVSDVHVDKGRVYYSFEGRGTAQFVGDAFVLAGSHDQEVAS